MTRYDLNSTKIADKWTEVVETSPQITSETVAKNAESIYLQEK